MPPGPFGSVASFTNRGDTNFGLLEGVVNPPATPIFLADRFALAPALGRVVICSNFHWICDPGGWMGGLFAEGENTVLWLNLAAAACRARS
jgi:hypothetical protein